MLSTWPALMASRPTYRTLPGTPPRRLFNASALALGRGGKSKHGPRTAARFNLKAIKQTSTNNATNPVRIPSAQKLRDKCADFPAFGAFGMREEVVKAVEAMGVWRPNAVQVMAVPEIMERKNVLFAAETGTGKTLTYLAPLVHHLRTEEVDLTVQRRDRRPRAVVLVPSRELTQQVGAVAKQLSHVAKLRVEVIVDKIPKNKGHFSGPVDLVVGLPSKVMHYGDTETLSFNDVRYVVVDEADTMLEKDFGEQVRSFLARLTRRTSTQVPLQLIFTSATIPKSLNDFIDREFPGQFVKLASPRLHRTLPSLRQRFIKLEGHGDNKQRTLLKTLFEAPPKDEPTMIFCNTLGGVRALESWLTGLPEVVEMAGGPGKIVALHARMTRDDRAAVYERFKSGEVTTLICTDIASRGVDTLAVKHVVLYDFPYSAIDYLHRVGRTARNGTQGKATSLVAKKDRELAAQIQDAVKRRASIA